MKRAYVLLAVCALAGALLLAAVARPRTAVLPNPSAPVPASTVTDRITLTITKAAILPARVEVPHGTNLEIHMENRDAVVHTASLLGYEREIAPTDLPPGGAATLRFRADRPGGDFAWIVDGTPAGLFVVRGSHLVEGHR